MMQLDYRPFVIIEICQSLSYYTNQSAIINNYIYFPF